ncbi:Retrovirus-related Pol polyprotein from transposon TNT 1-94 [Sesamum angolense]|uniref:Retrovirus-related Pol polyprotein from transposon TNT 1-94 n=1 Tax=Sesamum angolense TaxID=2727404 RepID=A0AAE1WVL6_9LAMI|nr:Retrovirus-related Pol polyprotein from transposon TNT 1-94 [Sesamum angolense]
MLSNTSPIYGPHSYESTRGPVMAMAQEARPLQLPRLKNTTSKKMMTDLPQIQAVEGACEACLQGKQHKKPFPSRTFWRAKAVLELIHTEVCGPMRTPSHEQNRYFILFIDDYSRMTWVYFMREKSEVFKVFKKFKNLVEKQSGRSIKVLRSDRGKEYNNSEFDKFCEEEGIEHQTTVSYNPQQNGVSERKKEQSWRWQDRCCRRNTCQKLFGRSSLHCSLSTQQVSHQGGSKHDSNRSVERQETFS